MKNQLFNLSAYAKAYENRDGSLKGVILSGYTNGEKGKRTYCNMWIPAELVRIRACKDGAPMISIKMTEITLPKPKNGEDADDEL